MTSENRNARLEEDLYMVKALRQGNRHSVSDRVPLLEKIISSYERASWHQSAPKLVVHDRGVIPSSTVTRAANRRPVLAAVRELEALGNKVEASRGLLEAQLRLLTRKLEPLPELPTQPEWLEDALEDLLDEGSSILPFVIKSVGRLVCAAVAAKEGLEGQLRPGPRGSIEVIWDCEARIRWLVQPARIKWPGIEVRAYRVVDPSSLELVAQSFWTAHTLIADFNQVLERITTPQVLLARA